MKIESTLKAETTTKVKDLKSGKNRTLNRALPQNGVHDEVELTADGSKMKELEDRLAELEITDPGKVETIRQAIADGTFQVHDEVVADALIKEAIDLLSNMNKR